MHGLMYGVELLIVCWLPGAILFRLPWLDRDRRAALDAEERLFWSVVISLAVSLSAVLALAVWHRYSFTRLLVADLTFAAAAAAAARFRLRLAGAKRIGWTALLPLALVLLGCWRFFPTAEYIIGGKDPGGYVNEGVQIAQRGAILIQDATVRAVPPFARDLFFPSYKRPDYYSLLFMGFFVKNPEAGTVIGQFPHLFPASIAIGYGIDGLTGALRTVGVWAILGLLAVYFAGARLLGRPAAFAAATLLALHVIEVWFARYPNAEVVMQALLFAALLANARAHVDDDRFFAPVAGVLLALLLFLRFDAVLGIAGVGAGLVLGVFNGARVRIAFVATFAAGAALAVAYLLGPMRAYADLPLVFLSHLPWWEYALLGLAGLASMAAVAFASKRSSVNDAVVAWAPTAIVVMACLAAAYALYLRQPGGKTTLHDAYALRMFTAFYLTLPALVAALLGLAIVARRAFWRDPALIATAVIFSFFFFYKIRVSPDHFWMTRRFLPVILPSALLLACGATFTGARYGWNGPQLRRLLIRVAFVSLLALQYGRASRPVMGHVEYAGLIPRVEQLAGTIGDDDLTIVESRDAGGDTHVLAMPLAFIYARHVLVLASARPDKAAFAAFVEWARTKYTRVLFIGGGGTDLLSYRYDVKAIDSERFQVPEYDAPVNAYPRYVRRKEFDFGVYAFANPAPRVGQWFDLDVGVRDDLHVLRFHAKEETEGRTFRWTGATSYVSVTVIHATARGVTLWMSNGGRPTAAPPPQVDVYFHGQLLGTIDVTAGFRAYTLAIPPELARRAADSGDPVELKLVTPTWNPHKALGAADDRALGVMLDRVAVR